MSLRARLAAWIDATFWPGLDEPRQPCLTVAEMVASMTPPDTAGGLVHLPTSGLWPDRRALEAMFPEDAARRRARSLRVSLC